jgi:hypothetical protein
MNSIIVLWPASSPRFTRFPPERSLNCESQFTLAGLAGRLEASASEAPPRSNFPGASPPALGEHRKKAENTIES